MKKLQVSYCFEVHKLIEIDVDELVYYLDENEDSVIDDVIEKYINDCFTIDSSDDLDELSTYLEITEVIEETEDDLEYLDEIFTIEDLKLLKDQKNINYE